VSALYYENAKSFSKCECGHGDTARPRSLRGHDYVLQNTLHLYSPSIVASGTPKIQNS
jgi:hypothetical protein